MKIMVTGGAGYIGSHTVHALKAEGKEIVVFDNLSKGHRNSVPEGVSLVVGDLRDTGSVAKVLRQEDIGAVVHFAADSLVGESMKDPAKYYDNNVCGTLSLLQAMKECAIDKIVFSSTAAVYGEPDVWPIREDMPTRPTNVYGRTKLIIEEMLADFAMAYGVSYVSLRYFNAAGAIEAGIIGEDHEPETHLIPLILKTALGQRAAIDVFGTDYCTKDGTCIRDYIHVSDLAAAHILAVDHLLRGGESRIFNLGSENGFSVREVIQHAQEITGINFPVREAVRRPGDPAVLVASSEKIKKELGWKPMKSDLKSIISSAWEWHRKYPNGYK